MLNDRFENHHANEKHLYRRHGDGSDQDVSRSQLGYTSPLIPSCSDIVVNIIVAMFSEYCQVPFE
jgi:hypothetical protein